MESASSARPAVSTTPSPEGAAISLLTLPDAIFRYRNRSQGGRHADRGFAMHCLGVHAILLLFLLLSLPAVSARELTPRPLPAFTQERPDAWFNSPPLKVGDLRGKVVLIDVWTYDCWNCYRSFPWLKQLESDLASRPFIVIGIHTPEFDHERDPRRVAAKIEQFGLHHPVMLDNDMAYWRALNNRYWPTYYLVDKAGRLRYRFVGETHAGDGRDRTIREVIDRLLAE
ncbi:MAG: thioredoxin [Gammaproteobacteria bacterium]|nr:MAG: thioredoxin [Gammaproteobacteria bacterium]